MPPKMQKRFTLKAKKAGRKAAKKMLAKVIRPKVTFKKGIKKFQRVKKKRSYLTQNTPLIVSRREPLGQINGHTNEYSTRLVEYITPNNPRLFPWLSTLAAHYQYFKFIELKFEFVSTVGSFGGATNNAIGETILARLSNVADPVPETLIQLEQYTPMSRKKTNKTNILNIDVKNRNLGGLPLREYYTSTAVEQWRLNDHNIGLIIAAVSGQPMSNTKIGEMFVHYKIALMKPQPVENNPQTFHAVSEIMVQTPGYGQLAPLRYAKIDSRSSDYSQWSITGENTVHFPSYVANGTYMVVFNQFAYNLTTNTDGNGMWHSETADDEARVTQWSSLVHRACFGWTGSGTRFQNQYASGSPSYIEGITPAPNHVRRSGKVMVFIVEITGARAQFTINGQKLVSLPSGNWVGWDLYIQQLAFDPSTMDYPVNEIVGTETLLQRQQKQIDELRSLINKNIIFSGNTTEAEEEKEENPLSNSTISTLSEVVRQLKMSK